MKVFISWSGETSRLVAKALKNWIPYVLQATTPFVSSSDIDRGRRWQEELVNELKQSSFGIICLTDHNIDAPWINFEAGAISNALNESSVSPFLFYVHANNIRGPLQQFQITRYGDDDKLNQAELFSLVSSMNRVLPPDQSVPEDRLKDEFDMWWPKCSKELNQIYTNAPVQGMSQYDWLYFENDILRAQDRIKCKVVWIVTSNLDTYSSNTTALTVIENNLTRDVQYIFIVPESSDNDTARDELNRRFGKCSNKPIINLYEASKFDAVAAANYVILNPDYQSGCEQKMYLELPITSHIVRWIEVESEAMQKFVTRFRPYAESRG